MNEFYACMYVCMHLYQVCIPVSQYTYLTGKGKKYSWHVANMSHTAIYAKWICRPTLLHTSLHIINCYFYLSCYGLFVTGLNFRIL